jgi:DNA processing protein
MLWDAKASAAVQTKIPLQIEELTENEQIVFDKLHEQEDGMQINYIVQETRLSYPQVSSTLMMLEMKGIVRSLPGGIYRAVK